MSTLIFAIYQSNYYNEKFNIHMEY